MRTRPVVVHKGSCSSSNQLGLLEGRLARVLRKVYQNVEAVPEASPFQQTSQSSQPLISAVDDLVGAGAIEAEVAEVIDDERLVGYP
jgi:hypothetical protein